MKYYTVEFDDEKKTGLKIFYDPDDPNQWKNIKICKTEGGEDTEQNEVSEKPEDEPTEEETVPEPEPASAEPEEEEPEEE